MVDRIGLRAAAITLLITAAVLALWFAATWVEGGAQPRQVDASQEVEYVRLLGSEAATDAPQAGFPGPALMGQAVLKQLSNPFYDYGPNDKGIGLQLGHSLLRVGVGFLLAALIAIPLGFVLGQSPLMQRALHPFVHILKSISPLAWMPLALFTIKDSALSGVFVVFVCSLWPMLLHTVAGVAGVRKEWLNVAKTLEVSPARKAFHLVLPAAAPAILAGMRNAMGIAWLVIVAAEMLVGGTGIGCFVWNEWNKLSLTGVMLAILTVGVVGMLLDSLFAHLQRRVSYVD